MPSIRWIRHLEVDGEQMTIEIMLGTEHISDKCYVRINSESEMYFRPESETRQGIIASGIDILKKHFKGSVVRNLNGSVYQWN